MGRGKGRREVGSVRVGIGHLVAYSSCFVRICSGGSRIFERGVQVQVDYSNSTDCFIITGEYVYAETAKLVPIRAKRGNFSKFRTFEIASAGFSGPIQRALVRRSSKLLHLFHRPCGADSFCSWLVKLHSDHADKFFTALRF